MTAVICPWIRTDCCIPICLHSSIYTVASTNINLSAPNMVKMYTILHGKQIVSEHEYLHLSTLPGWLGVGLLTWWLWVRDLVEAKFLSSVFSPLTSAEACEKSIWWLWKEICVATGVRKPGNTCVADCHDMTLAVKVALNRNTTNSFIETSELINVKHYVSAWILHTFCMMMSRKHYKQTGKMIFLMVLTLPKWQISDSSKPKEIADDNSIFDENSRKFSKNVENTAGKGEIARYKQFLLFTQCFQKTCTADM